MRTSRTLFGLAVVLAIAAQAMADDNKQPAEQKFDETGTLSTGTVTIGGETTGITLKTEHGIYELSMIGELARKAQGLDGKNVHVIGTLQVVAGVEVKERRIVAVNSLAQVEQPNLLHAPSMIIRIERPSSRFALPPLSEAPSAGE
jgi:hypothetical protein